LSSDFHMLGAPRFAGRGFRIETGQGGARRPRAGAAITRQTKVHRRLGTGEAVESVEK
jgi:hypothetical protein